MSIFRNGRHEACARWRFKWEEPTSFIRIIKISLERRKYFCEFDLDVSDPEAVVLHVQYPYVPTLGLGPPPPGWVLDHTMDMMLLPHSARALGQVIAEGAFPTSRVWLELQAQDIVRLLKAEPRLRKLFHRSGGPPVSLEDLL